MRLFLATCVSFVMLGAVVSAQTVKVTVTPLTDSDIQLLRSDIQASKEEIITATMQFSNAESTAFWPVYREYATKQQAIGDERLKLIKDYAATFDTMDDNTAKDMVQRTFDIENRTLKLRKDYWPKFTKALGAKRAAKFYQVDYRLSLFLNVQLSDAIPLIP